MYYIVPPQAFVPRRLTNHLLRKHVPSCIPVDLWEKQRLQDAYKARLACELAYKSTSPCQYIRASVWTGDSWA